MTDLELEALRLINVARETAGLTPLRRSWLLHAYARRHARKMRERGRIFHGDPGQFWMNEGRTWAWWGENVGAGYDIPSLHRAFMQSSGHRANILGRFRRGAVGISVSSDAGYTIWIVHAFMRP